MNYDNREKNLCLATIILLVSQFLLLTIIISSIMYFPSVKIILFLVSVFLGCHLAMFIVAIYLCVNYPHNHFGRIVLIATVCIYILLLICFILFVACGAIMCYQCCLYCEDGIQSINY